jgi:hypothetical protein
MEDGEGIHTWASSTGCVYVRKWGEPNSFFITMNEITLEDGIIAPKCALEAGNDG